MFADLIEIHILPFFFRVALLRCLARHLKQSLSKREKTVQF